MCRLVAMSWMVLVLNVVGAFGAEFRLMNGDVYRGEASFNEDGLVVRLDIGGFSPRISWGKLTQETLKEIAEDPRAREFAEPFIEVPIEVREAERRQRKEIRISEPPTVPLPPEQGGFFASMTNPVGWFILGVLYLANLYAGFEVARFKGRPMVLVVGLSAIAPIIGPIIFALLPRGGGAAAGGETAEAGAAAPAEAVNPMAQALPSGMGGGGLGLAAHGAKAAAGTGYNQVYNRSNTTFDRRFFETKFTGFFRVVPGDAEKDLVMVIKTPKSEIVATRITRISAGEAHFQLQRGAELNVPFGEMVEVSTRHKGAK
jgi:hypothetical protein